LLDIQCGAQLVELMLVNRSAFVTIRHRTKRSKGCLSRDGMLHMMLKLEQYAKQNWRKLRGFDYLAKVITGLTFKNGIEATEPDQIAA
jgi:putative transposase